MLLQAATALDEFVPGASQAVGGLLGGLGGSLDGLLGGGGAAPAGTGNWAKSNAIDWHCLHQAVFIMCLLLKNVQSRIWQQYQVRNLCTGF